MGDVDQLRHTRERYYTSPMSMGKRKRDRQPAMWVTTTDLPTAASHPFYRRLNQLLREHGFDDFVEARMRSIWRPARLSASRCKAPTRATRPRCSRRSLKRRHNSKRWPRSPMTPSSRSRKSSPTRAITAAGEPSGPCEPPAGRLQYSAPSGAAEEVERQGGSNRPQPESRARGTCRKWLGTFLSYVQARSERAGGAVRRRGA